MKKQFINANAICLLAKAAVATKEDTQLVVVGGKQVELAKLDKMLEEMEEGEELTADYFEIEEGESVRAFVIGKRKFKKTNDKGEETVSDAILMYVGGKKVIAAQAMIVSNLLDVAEKAEQNGTITPVQIEFLSKEKAAVGKVHKFRVTLLAPKS